MKLFISWSGPRSKALAEALREWTPLVLPYAQPWMSESDIWAGERWQSAVATELETTDFGLICLSRDNLAMPWLLFEAGALAKSLRGRVIPLLLDLDYNDLSLPLAQFQAKKADKNGVYAVLRSIHQQTAPPTSEPLERMDRRFEMFWPELQDKVSSIPATGRSGRLRSQAETLDDLLVTVRFLEDKLRDLSDEHEYIQDQVSDVSNVVNAIHAIVSSQQNKPTGDDDIPF